MEDAEEEMIKAAESRECEINTICMNAVLSCFEKAQQWSNSGSNCSKHVYGLYRDRVKG